MMSDTERKVHERLRELGLTWEFTEITDDFHRHRRGIEIFAPDGKQLDSGLSSFICSGWKDALERLQYVKLPLENYVE